MKKIEGTILVECDVCWHVNPVTYVSTCYVCGHTVCLACLYRQKFVCPICEGNYLKSIPK